MSDAPEPVALPTPKRRSYSQLSSYARCSENYRLERLVRPKLPQRPAAWTAHGLAFHEAAETWERAERQEDFVALYDAAFDAQIEAFTEIQPNLWMWQRPWNKKTTELHIAAQKETGLIQAAAYPKFIKEYGLEPMRDENDMPAVEIGFELDFAGVPVVGYIDIVRQFGDMVIPVDIKGLALDTPIATPSGWTTMGGIKVGDKLFAADGSVTKVVLKSEVKNKVCYEVTFCDGSSVVCDDEHLWVVNDRVKHSAGTVVGIQDIARSFKADDNRSRYSVDVAQPLKLPAQKLEIDPYLLGVWLGDGRARGGEITSADQEIFDRIEARGTTMGPDIGGKDRTPSRTPYGMRAAILSLDLQNNKHIPMKYKRGSIKQRLELLRGLMDSDGCWNKGRNQAVFVNTNLTLAQDVHELALSLGFRPKIHPYTATGFGKTVQSYRVTFSVNGDLNPFALSRKADQVVGGVTARVRRRVIKNVRAVESVPTQCIMVDSEDHTFLCGREMIPTHNTGNRVKASTQLGLYKIALEEIYGYSVSHGEFLYTKGDKKAPNEAAMEKVNLDKYTRAYFEEMFATLERGIQNEVFIPSPSDACGLCAVKDYCREMGTQPVPLNWETIDVNDRWW